MIKYKNTTTLARHCEEVTTINRALPTKQSAFDVRSVH
jgi:hypothetical protein